jgi:hypothetical protein
MPTHDQTLRTLYSVLNVPVPADGHLDDAVLLAAAVASLELLELRVAALELRP